MTVAQRGQQQDAQRIACLGQRGYHSGIADPGVEGVAHDAQHRLAVVNGRHAQTGAGGQQENDFGGKRIVGRGGGG
ncbi:hypothetical protein D3C79_423600 [compost metagenome]